MTTRTLTPEAPRKRPPDRIRDDYCRTCGMTYVHWAGCPGGEREMIDLRTQSGGTVRMS